MQSPSASDLANYFSLTQTQKLLRYGNYYTQLKPFLKVFKENEIIFYDGNRLGKIQSIVLETLTRGIPSDLDQFEAESIEDSLKLGHEMVFDFDKAKDRDLRPYAIFSLNEFRTCRTGPVRRSPMEGFPCLVKPVHFCLSAAKGRKRTMNVSSHMAAEIKILNHYYKPEMIKTAQLLVRNVTLFCTTDKPIRFEWLREYICP